mmetsp:Transcript_24618/g.60389  ORF Transcript_24618/g.60389 Transcript_24618/m.60389 type:complete len:254 (-) Transcript_24618:141-902(-)
MSMGLFEHAKLFESLLPASIYLKFKSNCLKSSKALLPNRILLLELFLVVPSHCFHPTCKWSMLFIRVWHSTMSIGLFECTQFVHSPLPVVGITGLPRRLFGPHHPFKSNCLKLSKAFHPNRILSLLEIIVKVVSHISHPICKSLILFIVFWHSAMSIGLFVGTKLFELSLPYLPFKSNRIKFIKALLPNRMLFLLRVPVVASHCGHPPSKFSVLFIQTWHSAIPMGFFVGAKLFKSFLKVLFPYNTGTQRHGE